MGDNLLINGDFQDGWATLDGGNQVPDGWQLVILSNGSTMYWPRKHYANSADTMPAIAERQPECVFKLSNQLPEIERFGQALSLILAPAGKQVYKLFHGPSAWRIFQDVTLTAGRRVRFTAWVLADTRDVARGPAGVLEPDHCWVKVAVGQNAVERNYSELSGRFDAPGNQRAWNKFAVEHTVEQASTRIEIVGQQNWRDDPTGVSFFVGPLWLEYIDGPAPEPEPDPDDTVIVITPGELAARIGVCDQIDMNLDQTLLNFDAAHTLIDMARALNADTRAMLVRLLTPPT